MSEQEKGILNGGAEPEEEADTGAPPEEEMDTGTPPEAGLEKAPDPPPEQEVREVYGPPPPEGIEQLLEEEEPAGGVEVIKAPKKKKKRSWLGRLFRRLRKKRKKRKAEKTRAKEEMEDGGEIQESGETQEGGEVLEDPETDQDSGEERAKPKKGGRSGSHNIVTAVILMIAAVILLTSLLTSILLKMFGMRQQPASPTPPPESESQPAEDSPEPTPTPTPEPTPTSPLAAGGTTQSQAVEYIQSLTPDVLGLEGDAMEEYELYPGSKVVMVNDIPCVEVFVYSDQNPTGTNDIQGRYLLSRTNPRRLFRLDLETETVTEISLEGVRVETAPPSPQASQDGAGEAASGAPEEGGGAGDGQETTD